MERSSMIDLPLDDIIKLNDSSRKRSRPSESFTPALRSLRSSAPVPHGPASYFPAPAAPYPYPTPPMVPRMLLPTAFSGGDSREGTKLYVSNLDYDVSNEDIKKAMDVCGNRTTELVGVEILAVLLLAMVGKGVITQQISSQLLFSDVGTLKHSGIHCDRSGRPTGTADVVFFRLEDAIAAVRRYNNLHLDGKPLKIELVGTNLIAPTYCYEPYRAPVGGQRPPVTLGHNCNTGWGPPQGGRGRRRYENVKPTAEALDADLDRHRLKAGKASKLAEGP